jgi:hypothetical protein
MVTKVTSVRQFRLNSSLYVSGLTGRAGAPRSFFLCGTMPGNVSRRRTTTRQLTTFAFSLHEMSQCIGPMDNRTEQAKKALGRSTYESDTYRFIYDGSRIDRYLVSSIDRKRSTLIIDRFPFDLSEQIRPSINRFESLAFRSFQPRHNSRHNKKEASETARSARFAAPNYSYSRESQPKDSIRTS